MRSGLWLVAVIFLAGCAPQMAMTSHERGDSMIQHRQHSAAVYWYGRAIAEDPTDAGAYAGRARGLSQDINLDDWPADKPDADLKGALADLDKAIELHPKSYQLYLNRGTVRGAAGQLDGALADMNKGLELNPADGLGHGYKGFVLLRMFRDDEAKVEFDQCLRMMPGAWGHLRKLESRIRAKRGAAPTVQAMVELSVEKERACLAAGPEDCAAC